MARRTKKDYQRAQLHAWSLYVRGVYSFEEIAAAPNPDDEGRPLFNSAGKAREAVLEARRFAADMDDVEGERYRALSGLLDQKLDLNRRLGRVARDDWRAATAIHRTLLMLDQRVAMLMGLDAADRWADRPAAVAGRDEVIRSLMERGRRAQLEAVPDPETVPVRVIEVEAREA